MPPRRRAPARKKAPARRRAPARKRAPRVKVHKESVPRMIVSMPGSQTQTRFSHGHGIARIRKGLTALGVPSYYVFNKAYTIQPPGGTQGVAVIGQWNSVPDVYQMMLTATYGSYTTSSASPMKFHVRSLQAELMLTNSTNVGCVMDIYDIACKQDAPHSSTTGPTENVSTPVNAWLQGETKQLTSAIPAGYTSGVYVPGSIPKDSQIFKDYYKIVSKKSIAFGAGASHQHIVNLRIPRQFDQNETTTHATYLNGLRGFTMFTMVVVRGQIASSAGPGGNEPSQNSTVLIRAVATERYEYQWLQANGSTKTYNLSMPAPGSAGVAMVDTTFASAAVATS